MCICYTFDINIMSTIYRLQQIYKILLTHIRYILYISNAQHVTWYPGTISLCVRGSLLFFLSVYELRLATLAGAGPQFHI